MATEEEIREALWPIVKAFTEQFTPLIFAVGVACQNLAIAFEDKGMLNDPGWNHFV